MLPGIESCEVVHRSFRSSCARDSMRAPSMMLRSSRSPDRRCCRAVAVSDDASLLVVVSLVSWAWSCDHAIDRGDPERPTAPLTGRSPGSGPAATASNAAAMVTIGRGPEAARRLPGNPAARRLILLLPKPESGAAQETATCIRDPAPAGASAVPDAPKWPSGVVGATWTAKVKQNSKVSQSGSESGQNWGCP